MDVSAPKSGNRSRKARRARKLDQRFSDYIWFGFQSTVCLGLFVGCYVLVLVVMWPLLVTELPPSQFMEKQGEHGQPDGHEHRLHMPAALKQVAQHDREVVSEVAGAMKERLQQLRQGRGVTDADLLEQTKLDFEERRKKKQLEAQKVIAATERKNHIENAALAGNTNRQGVVILGMHRSGTSMLSGLLVTSCGYEVGGPLIGSAFDNEKGFFERIDVVLQNDEFMKAQNVWWAANVIHYDWEQALRDKESGTVDFKKHGNSAVAFLNNPKNSPWLQKDPRMCITLKTWLKLLTNEPAAVFTYRHPLEVAMSLKRREKNFTLERGLRLWIVYNMRAIQNSRGMCVVYSSNDAVLAEPMVEVQRISDELTSKCGVPEPPYRLKKEDVDKFIDPTLQHNKNKRTEEEKDKEVIATYNDGACVVRAYESETEEGSDARKRETLLYGWAMKIFCDMESKKAYEDSYEWPELPA